jgi:hyperosmotically inducible protein
MNKRVVLLLLAMVLVMSCAPPDAALTAEVKTKMAADSTVPAMRIEVDTKDGVVTLTGNVDRQDEKDRAIEIALTTGGVVDVVDMISVRVSAESGDAPEPSRTVGQRIDDAAITLAVKNRLLDDPAVKGLRIDVDTREGIVYLTGVVRSAVEKNRAVQLARETAHVRDVQENITVRG